jgi:hypothetical protein
MNTKDYIRLCIPLGEATRRATDFISKFILGGGDKARLEEEVKTIIANPSAFTEDSLRGEFAKALLNAPPPPRSVHIPTVVGHPFRFISDSHSNSKRTPVPIDIGQ